MPMWNKCSWKRPPRRYLKTTPTILSIVVTVVRKSLLAWRITRFFFFIASTHIEKTYLGSYYRLKCKIKIQSIHIIWWIVERILCNLNNKILLVASYKHVILGRERESTIFGHGIVKVVQYNLKRAMLFYRDLLVTKKKNNGIRFREYANFFCSNFRIYQNCKRK